MPVRNSEAAVRTASVPSSLVAVVKTMAKEALSPVFLLPRPLGRERAALTRSAVFLVVFSVVHGLGNAFLFGGRHSYNMYGHKLHVNPLIRVIECYLLISGVVHAVVGAQRAWFKFSKGRAAVAAPHNRDSLWLALTGTVLAVFVVLHVRSFRLGEYIEYETTDDAGTANKMRDLYELVQRKFQSRTQVTWYTVATSLFLIHVWKGWNKAVTVLPIERQHKANAVTIGRALIGVIGSIFLACPMYVHLRPEP